jgi:hypothetical protein
MLLFATGKPRGCGGAELSLCFFNHWSDGDFPTFGGEELERLLGVLREDVAFGCDLA